MYLTFSNNSLIFPSEPKIRSKGAFPLAISIASSTSVVSLPSLSLYNSSPLESYSYMPLQDPSKPARAMAKVLIIVPKANIYYLNNSVA